MEDGLLFFEDPDIGRRVDEIDKKGFPFQTEEGLDFCRRSILDDTASSGLPFFLQTHYLIDYSAFEM